MFAPLFRSTSRMVRSTDFGAKDMIPNTTMDIPCPEPAFLPGSRDVNLVLMVKEQAPVRLKDIERELTEMATRREKLEAEVLVLTRLLAAVEPR